MDEHTPLKREIGSKMLIVFVVGDILGAGIYVRVGGVAAEVGGAIWLSFLVAMFIAAFTALSYAELTSKYPGSGGAALFVNKAYGQPFITFMVAFAVVSSGIASAGTVARAFAGRYLQEFISVPSLPVALLFLGVIALVNLRGISESIKVNLALTVVEVLGLLLIVGIGIVALADGSGDPGRAFTIKEGVTVPLAILSGASVAFYALIGFEDVVNVAEETKDPVRMMPVAILAGLGIATVLYLAVSFTAAMVVNPQTLGASSGALLEVVEAGPIPVPPRLYSLIALLAITNTALINMIMASRLTYAMAQQGIVPAILGKTHRERQTPWMAIVCTTLLAVGLVATGDLGSLADTTVMLLLVVFAIVNVTVLVLRRDMPGHAHFSVPTVVPVIGALTCLVLLTQQDADIYLRGGALLLVGLALWMVNWFVHRRLNPI